MNVEASQQQETSSFATLSRGSLRFSLRKMLLVVAYIAVISALVGMMGVQPLNSWVYTWGGMLFVRMVESKDVTWPIGMSAILFVVMTTSPLVIPGAVLVFCRNLYSELRQPPYPFFANVHLFAFAIILAGVGAIVGMYVLRLVHQFLLLVAVNLISYGILASVVGACGYFIESLSRPNDRHYIWHSLGAIALSVYCYLLTVVVVGVLLAMTKALV
jgi:hypothetical protein